MKPHTHTHTQEHARLARPRRIDQVVRNESAHQPPFSVTGTAKRDKHTHTQRIIEGALWRRKWMIIMIIVKQKKKNN